jgi:hypothetical protein
MRVDRKRATALKTEPFSINLDRLTARYVWCVFAFLPDHHSGKQRGAEGAAAECSSRSALRFRRSICDEFTHGLKRRIRGNNGLAPGFRAFFRRSNGIVDFLVFFTLSSCASYELLIELFFDECRQKVLDRNSLAMRIAPRIAQLAKEMIRFLRQIYYVMHKME